MILLAEVSTGYCCQYIICYPTIVGRRPSTCSGRGTYPAGAFFSHDMADSLQIRSLCTASNTSFRAVGWGSLVGLIRDLSRNCVQERRRKTFFVDVSLCRVMMCLFAEGSVLPLIVTLMSLDCVLSVVCTILYGVIPAQNVVLHRFSSL